MHRIAFLLAFLSCFCNAQTPTAHLLIGGGLLGKLDGFCEIVNQPDPGDAPYCPPGRSPLGGLNGLRQEVQKAKGTDVYVLLAGNNLPKDFNAISAFPDDPFIEQLKSIGADVTALGQDDLLRAVFPAKLSGASVPSRFTRSVQDLMQRKDLRFLASNAAVRTNKTGMNTTWIKGYELMISADQSIPWTTSKLSFALPDYRQASVTVTLEGGGQILAKHI